MRKILLLPLLLFLGHSANAQVQTQAGNLLIGGGLGFDLRHEKGRQQELSYTTFGIGLSPQAGYFVADNWAVGMSLHYGSSWGKSSFSDRYFNNSRSYGGGPFARYYKMVSEKAGFFGQAAFNYGKSQSRNYDSGWDNSYSRTSVSVGISPGFTYFLHEKIGVEFLLGGLFYDSSTGNDEQGRSMGRSGSLGFGSSLGNAALGFRYYVTRQ